MFRRGLSLFTDNIPNGQNPDLYKIPKYKIQNWTKSQIGQNLELDKIQNGQNLELDEIPNWTKSRIGQNPELVKILNG